MAEIALAQYAERHGRTPDSARQMANRGGFRTARKLGRNWVIDEDEPYPDRRRSMKEALTKVARDDLDDETLEHELKIAQAKQYSRIGGFGTSFSRNLERVPRGLSDTLTPAAGLGDRPAVRRLPRRPGAPGGIGASPERRTGCALLYYDIVV